MNKTGFDWVLEAVHRLLDGQPAMWPYVMWDGGSFPLLLDPKWTPDGEVVVDGVPADGARALLDVYEGMASLGEPYRQAAAWAFDAQAAELTREFGGVGIPAELSAVRRLLKAVVDVPAKVEMREILPVWVRLSPHRRWRGSLGLKLGPYRQLTEWERAVITHVQKGEASATTPRPPVAEDLELFMRDPEWLAMLLAPHFPPLDQPRHRG